MRLHSSDLTSYACRDLREWAVAGRIDLRSRRTRGRRACSQTVALQSRSGCVSARFGRPSAGLGVRGQHDAVTAMERRPSTVHPARAARARRSVLLALLVWLPESARAATCREWRCTNPLFRISPTEQTVPTEQALAGVSADCASADLQHPVDCLCGCTTPGRVSVLILPLLAVAYAFIVVFFIFVIKWLRAKPKAEYAQLRRSQGMTEAELLDPNEALTMKTSTWMKKSTDEVLHDCGLDAAIYLVHCEQCSKYWMAQFCVAGIILCYVYRVHGDFEHSWNMFAWSYANLAPSNGLKWLPALAQFWFAGTTLWFVKIKQHAMNDYKHQAELEGRRHTSLNTVWIQGVASTATEQSLMRWFEQRYKGRLEVDEHGVPRAKLVWDVNALGHNVRLQRKWINQINELSKTKMEMTSKQKRKTESEITKLRQKMDTLIVWEQPLRQRGKRAAGSAFVTFSTEEHCLSFRRALPHHRVQDHDSTEGVALGLAKWSTQLAPRPADIYWENFGLDRNERNANHAKVTFWTLVLFGIFVIFGLAIMWTIGFLYFELLYRVYPKESMYVTHRVQYDAVGPVLWYGFGGVCAVLFLALEEEMSPMVKYLCKFDSPLTKSHKQSGYLHKIFFFYVIYHVLLTTLLFGKLVLWLEVADIEVEGVEGMTNRSGHLQLYVETVGAFHQNRLFLTSCVIDMLHAMEGFGYFTRKAKPLTAEEEGTFQGAEDLEDDEEELHADEGNRFLNCKFDYTRNYGESIAVMTSISCYAVMHPTIMFFGSIYFLIKYFVDKYQICNQYSRPQLQYGRRARTTTIVILASQVMAQYFNSVYFLVLAPEGMQGVGLLCLFSALGFTVLSTLYIYTPEALRVYKSEEATSKISSGTMGNGASAGKDQDLIRNIYNPPDPDSLQVGETLHSHPVSPGLLTTENESDRAPVNRQEAHALVTNPLASPLPNASRPAALQLDSDQARSQRYNVLQDHSIQQSPAVSSIWMSEQAHRQVMEAPTQSSMWIPEHAPRQVMKVPAPAHNPFNARVGGR